LEKRRLGRTGLEVVGIGFGGIPIAKRPRREAEGAVRRALEVGMNFFDTARAYGSSEERIGAVLSGWQSSHPIYVATKTYQRDRSGALADVERSLRNLRVERITLYQLHQVDDEDTLEKVFGPRGALVGLEEARKGGKIEWIGITGHRPDVLCRAVETGRFDTVQVPINIVDHYIFDTEETLLPLARRLDVGIIAMKPLAGGMLKDSSQALRFVLSREVDLVIPGLGSPGEVEEAAAVGSSYRPLSSLELKRLLEEVKELGNEFCRQCGYCLPCPANIDIPLIFRLEGYYDRYQAEEWARHQYRALSVRAGGCDGCGQCEARCPYRLPIREKLKRAEKKLLHG